MTHLTARHTELKEMLNARRQEAHKDIKNGLLDRGVDGPHETGRDDLERSETDIQGAISFALLQMKTETVARIDAALRAIDAGTYGSCIECENEISQRRLRALPFAVRCQSCEEAHEQAQNRDRRLNQRGFSLVPDLPRG